jgi:deoxyribonuclease V
VWPSSDEELVELQGELAERGARVLAADPWTAVEGALLGGCFVAYARGEAGPGHAGDRAWAAAVAWRPTGRRRQLAKVLRGTIHGTPRRASDVEAQAVVADRVPVSYAPGLLARREGPILAAAVAGLRPVPDVLLVDASGLDHPRRGGLAIHLGAVTGLPTVGVTRRPLVAEAGELPDLVRGASSPVLLDGAVVGRWVCTRTRARPVLAHAGWRTDPDTAAAVVLAASTEAARSPVPLQEARRVAREARALAGAG